MSNRSLLQHFARWQLSGESLVLATVIHTAGSTYSKAGRQILIKSADEYAGLVSGGCLEGDLAEHALAVLASNQSTIITYDMSAQADDLWGMGLGCNGLMQILLQPLTPENSWQPFADIALQMAQPAVTECFLITASEHPEYPVGTLHKGPPANSGVSFLCWQIQPWPRLLILGAGPDALPVVNMAHALGWETTVADHRPQYFSADRFATADHTLIIEATKLSEHLRANSFDAVIVMSHHIETDRTYLQQLAQIELRYLGLLGPAARKQKLLAELQLTDSPFAHRLHGPIGLDIGSDTPESIALSIVSEIQSVLHNSTLVT